MVTQRFAYALTLLALAGLVSPAVAQRVELLDFYLEGCGPCRQMEPIVARLASEGVPIRKVNGAHEPRLTQQLRVESYPTFVLMADGREVGRVVGATDYESLRGMLARAAEATVRPVANTFAADEGFAFSVGGDHGPGLPASAAPATVRPNTTATATTVSTTDRLLASAVRLTVNDPSGRSFGTGTIVDAREGEALVVTCAHLFRGPDGRPIDTTNRLSVELFDTSSGAARVSQRIEGQLISHDFEADVALVAIRPTGAGVIAAPVARSPGSIAVGDAARSVGCDLGADPTVRDSRVVTIDRYNGPPNIETTGAPVQGRSGGGLFNASGELIGVCFAADEPADEGLYAGLSSIHAQLDRIGLAAIYQASPASNVASVTPASAPLVAAGPATRPGPSPGALAPIPRAGTPAPRVADNGAVFRGQNALPSLAAQEQATLDEIVSRGDASEVVILIRSETGGPTEVMTLDSASPEFVSALRKMRSEGSSVLR